MKAPTVRHTTAGLVHFEAHEAFTMQPKEAHKYASLITRAALDAQRLQDKASGRTEWTATTVFPEGIVLDPSRYVMVTHMGLTRLFKRMRVGVSTPRRRPRYTGPTRLLGTFSEPRSRWHCEACDKPLPTGTVAYAQTERKAWEHPNWSSVRLCEPCVRPDHIGAALLKETQDG